MRRRGVESAREELPPFMAPLISRGLAHARRRRCSKAELRAEAAALVALYQGRVVQLRAAKSIEILCENCGHRGTICLPAVANPEHDRRRLRCKRCGHRQLLSA
jgi:hypothetical protein